MDVSISEKISYGRILSVVIGKVDRDLKTGKVSSYNYAGYDLSALHMTFTINKDVSKYANKCVVRVWNMSVDSYTNLITSTGLVLKVGIGHGTSYVGLVFTGDVELLNWGIQGQDTYVDITAFDSNYALLNAVLYKSYKPDTKISTIINDCEEVLKGMNVTIGHAFKELNKETKDLTLATYKNGLTVYGTVINIVAGILKPYNYYVYVENNVFIIAPQKWKTKGTAEQVYMFSKDSGLIGSPVIQLDKSVKLTVLLVPGITVGSVVAISSEAVNGTMHVVEITMKGSNYENDWMAELIVA